MSLASDTDALLRSLGLVLELRGLEPRGYLDRMARVAAAFSSRLELPDQELRSLRRSVYVHDLGKLDLPEGIARQAGPLTAPEWALVRLHTLISVDMLEPFSLRPQTLAAVRHHHEHYDGSGYPDGLRGEAIPLLARVLALVDSFMALTNHRHHRAALRHPEVLRELADARGKRLDPHLTDQFLALFNTPNVQEQTDDSPGPPLGSPRQGSLTTDTPLSKTLSTALSNTPHTDSLQTDSPPTDSPPTDSPPTDRVRAEAAPFRDTDTPWGEREQSPRRIGARFALLGADGASLYLSPALSGLLPENRLGQRLPLRDTLQDTLQGDGFRRRLEHCLHTKRSSRNLTLYLGPAPTDSGKASSKTSSKTEVPRELHASLYAVPQPRRQTLTEHALLWIEAVHSARDPASDPANDPASDAEQVLRVVAGRLTPMIVLDPQQTIIALNSAFSEQSGYSRDELIGQPRRVLDGPDTEAAALERLELALTQRQALELPLTQYRKGGEAVATTLRLEPIFSDQGELAYAVIALRDISARERAQLEDRRLVDLSQDIFAITDNEGRYLRVNSAYQRLLGYSPDALIGRPFYDFVHPDDVSLSLSVRPSVVPQQYFLSFENRLIGKDGQSRWFSWKITSFPSEGRMYWIGRDVTEKRRTEGALVESEALLNLIYETADVGICLTDPEGRFVKVNPAYRRLYGWSVGELIGEHFTKVVPEAIRRAASRMHDDFIAGTMRELPADWQVQRKDKRVVDVYVTAGRFVDRQGKPHKVTTVTDISARKESERQLAAFRSVLEPLPQAVLIARAHDLGVVYANPAFRARSGYSDPGALTLPDLFGGIRERLEHHPDPEQGATYTLRLTPKPAPAPKTQPRRDGRWRLHRSGEQPETAYWVLTELSDPEPIETEGETKSVGTEMTSDTPGER